MINFFKAFGAVMGNSAVHAECNADPKTHISEEQMAKASKGEPIDKELFGRHAVCMTTKMGILKQNGEIDKEAWKKILLDLGVDATEAGKVVNCPQVDSDMTNTAVEIMKCGRKHGLAQHEHQHGH